MQLAWSTRVGTSVAMDELLLHFTASIVSCLACLTMTFPMRRRIGTRSAIVACVLVVKRLTQRWLSATSILIWPIRHRPRAITFLMRLTLMVRSPSLTPPMVPTMASSSLARLGKTTRTKRAATNPRRAAVSPSLSQTTFPVHRIRLIKSAPAREKRDFLRGETR